MSSAIVGLIGAAIGALAGVAGAFISQRMQAGAAQKRALETKKEEAYSNTLRYMLRGQNRRGELTAEGTFIITDVATLIDDMVEAQFWASALTIYCSEEQRETVNTVSRDLNKTIQELVSGGVKLGKADPISKFSSWYEEILACAREDMRKSYVG
jgi:hypothetical protein